MVTQDLLCAWIVIDDGDVSGAATPPGDATAPADATPSGDPTLPGAHRHRACVVAIGGRRLAVDVREAREVMTVDTIGSVPGVQDLSLLEKFGSDVIPAAEKIA